MNAAERRTTRYGRHAAFLAAVTGLPFSPPRFDPELNAVVFPCWFIANAPDGGKLPCLIESRVSDPSDLIQ